MARKNKVVCKLVGTVVILAFCLGSVPAKAESDNEGWFKLEPGQAALALLLCCAYGYVTTGGLVIAIGNLYYGVKGERATPGWRIQGWVVGGINIVLGAVAIGLGVANDTDHGFGEKMGLASLAVGALDITFTIWSSSQPERKRRLTVNPIVMQDFEGNPAVGIGLRLVDW